MNFKIKFFNPIVLSSVILLSLVKTECCASTPDNGSYVGKDSFDMNADVLDNRYSFESASGLKIDKNENDIDNPLGSSDNINCQLSENNFKNEVGNPLYFDVDADAANTESFYLFNRAEGPLSTKIKNPFKSEFLDAIVEPSKTNGALEEIFGCNNNIVGAQCTHGKIQHPTDDVPLNKSTNPIPNAIGNIVAESVDKIGTSKLSLNEYEDNEKANTARFSKVPKETKKLLRYFFKSSDLPCITKLSKFLRLPVSAFTQTCTKKSNLLLVSSVGHWLHTGICKPFSLLLGSKVLSGKYNNTGTPMCRGNHPRILRSILTIGLVANCLSEEKIWYYYGSKTGCSGWVPAKFFHEAEVKPADIASLVSKLKDELEKRVKSLTDAIKKNINDMGTVDGKLDKIAQTINKLMKKFDSGCDGFRDIMSWKNKQTGESLRKIINDEILRPALKLIDRIKSQH